MLHLLRYHLHVYLVNKDGDYRAVSHGPPGVILAPGDAYRHGFECFSK